VIAERGYESIHRPTSGDQRQRQRLTRLKIPPFATRESYYFPGMLLPVFGPTGAKVSYQWKPRYPVPDHDGKRQKYISPKGQKNRLDVHPRNRNTIADPTVELSITEGIKKGDSLTSRGICVISVTGAFNWRSTLGTHGDWEDVPLRPCRDDLFRRRRPDQAQCEPGHDQAGRWLKSKGVRKVWYLIVQAEVNGKPVKGADDFLAAAGTLEELKAARTTKPPNPDVTDDTFSDARLAETIADDVLADQFMWVSRLGWLVWDGRQMGGNL
jgi:putative DNA primase/helicase